jgi:pimeloyl-ACP methyl ester carboxylesterase
MAVSTAAVLTACSGDDVMATIGMPTTEAAPAHGTASASLPGPPQTGGGSNALVVTDRQRGYLDGLAAAGVKPSSDLVALSIGSYVCQAHAARHDDQEVWDSVYPLVRSDVTDRVSSMVPSAPDVNAMTSDYIRIATERLC